MGDSHKKTTFLYQPTCLNLRCKIDFPAQKFFFLGREIKSVPIDYTFFDSTIIFFTEYPIATNNSRRINKEL